MQHRNAEDLRASRCVPCEGGISALGPEQAREQLKEFPGWQLTPDAKRIRREWMRKNFLDALEFFQAVARIAEEDGHHPDLHLTEYRRASIELWTHAIGGLSENDFILAAKIDALDDTSA